MRQFGVNEFLCKFLFFFCVFVSSTLFSHLLWMYVWNSIVRWFHFSPIFRLFLFFFSCCSCWLSFLFFEIFNFLVHKFRGNLVTRIVWSTHSSPLTTRTLLCLSLLLWYKTSIWWTRILLLLIVRLTHWTCVQIRKINYLIWLKFT